MFKLTYKDNIDVAKATHKIKTNVHVAELERMGNGIVYVGFPASAKNEDGLTIAKYAKWNNYGTFTHDEFGHTTSRIPARPFLTEGFYAAKYTEARTKLAKFLTGKVVKGLMSGEDALHMLGTQAVKHVQDAIKNGPWIPNAPSTEAKKLAKTKGKKSKYGVKPLIDTGDMITSVTYVVEMPK